MAISSFLPLLVVLGKTYYTYKNKNKPPPLGQDNFVLLPNVLNIKDKTSHSDFSMKRLKNV